MGFNGAYQVSLARDGMVWAAVIGDREGIAVLAAGTPESGWEVTEIVVQGVVTLAGTWTAPPALTDGAVAALNVAVMHEEGLLADRPSA